MENAIVQEVSSVFGITDTEDVRAFLNAMEFSKEKEPPSETYFETLLEKIPEARIVEGKVSSENEIHFNKSRVMGGQFGTVMFNKDKPQFIYKLQSTKYAPKEEGFAIYLKQILNEALLNVILQSLPESKPYTCRIFKVYKHYKAGTFPSYDIIFKLENLKGRSVKDTLIPRFPFLKEQTPRSDEDNNVSVNYRNMKEATDKEKSANNRLLVKIMAPLYKVLQEDLREKYDFFHGDMHTDNLMFIEDPIKEDGTFDESKLAIKMIDFAFSTMKVGGKQYGYYPRRFHMIHKEVSIFRYLSDAKQMPDDITKEVEKLINYTTSEELLQNVNAFEKYIVQQAQTMTGGKRKKTRKQQKKKRKVSRRLH